jgi:glycosyl transferase family 25
MVRGEVGCFLAHRAAWRRVTEGPDELVLVLEDDAVLAAGDLEAIRAVAARRELDAMITLLFTVSRPTFRRWREVGGVSIVHPADTIHSTVAYMVGKEGAAHLLAHSENFFSPVDDYLNMGYLHGVSIVLTYPFLAGHCSTTPSLIGLRTKAKLTARQYLKRNGFRLIRRLRTCLHGISMLRQMGLLFSRTERLPLQDLNLGAK